MPPRIRHSFSLIVHPLLIIHPSVTGPIPLYYGMLEHALCSRSYILASRYSLFFTIWISFFILYLMARHPITRWVCCISQFNDQRRIAQRDDRGRIDNWMIWDRIHSPSRWDIPHTSDSKSPSMYIPRISVISLQRTNSRNACRSRSWSYGIKHRHSHCFQAVDSTSRDLRNNSEWFGGITMI